ncbi:hypothetical protein RFI_16591 [Reticulomyxa filosa]|uniref:Adenylate cyclase-associated CAP C-terminal domain-containing protein n=1 Tax=Reticulomyxa filosa TaxID=46433 RepID=X6N3H1_RETFI|nr:hypothetical protein RFI_16591 [Reticulomyxa filosa]|eukprot:ETO20626.1 hypothetical protein RFI_16591 [Reticulomyxa filosa]
MDEIFLYNCENSGYIVPGKVKCITIGVFIYVYILIHKKKKIYTYTYLYIFFMYMYILNGIIVIIIKKKKKKRDHCKKVQMEINEVISTVEIVNSESVTLFVKGSVKCYIHSTFSPSISVDKCSQPRLVIYQGALDKQPKIITSMVTDMNIEIPPESDDLDCKVIAIPYQFETVIDPKTKVPVTKPVEHG